MKLFGATTLDLSKRPTRNQEGVLLTTPFSRAINEYSISSNKGCFI